MTDHFSKTGRCGRQFNLAAHLLLCLVVTVSALGAGWEALGPFGGSAAIVLVDRHHSDTVLAATRNAQIFRSEDAGDSWRPLPFPAEFRATLHAFAADRQNPGVFFVGLSSDSAEYSGIMRTSDSGLTWNRIPEPELRSVWSIAIWPLDSRVIAAGVEDGILLTRDGGESWDRVTPLDHPDLKPVVSLTFDPEDSNILYAGTPHLAWKTADGGETWQSIHDGMLDDSDVFSILVDARRPHRIFAATCGGIYRSVDGGTGWTKLKQAKGASFRSYHIAQNPLRPNVLLAGTTLGLVKSIDGGTTWRRLSAHPTRWISFDPAQPDRVFIATDDAGLFRSDDGGESLQEINWGFSNRHFTTLASADNALYVTTLTTGGSSILRHSDSGSDWAELSDWDELSDDPPLSELLPTAPFAKPVDEIQQALTDDLGILDVVTLEGGDLLAATSRGLAKSQDGGLTWHPVTGTLGGTTVSALCRHPTRTGVLFASLFGEIFQSGDDGRNWTSLTASGERPNDLIALHVLPGHPDWLYALSRSRGLYAMALTDK